MANIAWIVERRETASQVLVDCMQKVGNASSLRYHIFSWQLKSMLNLANKLSARYFD